jgi:hypothetical protein
MEPSGTTPPEAQPRSGAAANADAADKTMFGTVPISVPIAMAAPKQEDRSKISYYMDLRESQDVEVAAVEDDDEPIRCGFFFSVDFSQHYSPKMKKFSRK